MIRRELWELAQHRLVVQKGQLRLETTLGDEGAITVAVPDLAALGLLYALRQHLTPPPAELPDFETMSDHVNLWSAPTLRGRFRVTFIGRYVRLAHDHVDGRDDTVSVQLTDDLARELHTALGHWLDYRASQAEEPEA